MKQRIFALLLLIIGIGAGFFVYNSEIAENSDFKFKYGLDLQSGIHLTYKADVSQVQSGEVADTMDSLRQTIERRINVFGVSEPIVQVESGGLFSSEENNERLIVELPGITDLDAAVRMIGETPLLEFKLQTQNPEILAQVQAREPGSDTSDLNDLLYEPTGLTGSLLKRATLTFHPTTGEPAVSVEFNNEGKDLLTKVTSENVGRIMAIFLDGQPISTPVIRQEIFGGIAQISGRFTPDEAKQLKTDLNFGALPVPIELIETQTIGASLGHDTLDKGVSALVIGLIAIFAFLILWYRGAGIIAAISLLIYVALMFALFKLVPVVLTASGIAGFILSIGMAVDANVLIFERLKEEMRNGASIKDAIQNGANRAWPSIRDGNISSLISAVILYWFSGTSLVKGFALVFGFGVILSMFTAIVISRALLLAVNKEGSGPIARFLFSSGLNK